MRLILVFFFIFILVLNKGLCQEGNYFHRSGNDTVKITLLGGMYVMSGRLGMTLRSDMGSFYRFKDTLNMTSVYDKNIYSIFFLGDAMKYSISIYDQDENITHLFNVNINDQVLNDTLKVVFEENFTSVKLSFMYNEIEIPLNRIARKGDYVVKVHDNFWAQESEKMKDFLIFRNDSLFEGDMFYEKYRVKP